MTRVLIGGDICPTEGNADLFKKGDVDTLFNGLLMEFQQSDLSIVNLEGPLIEKTSPFNRIKGKLGAEDVCINAIKQAGIDVLSLANNHIMDCGPRGLEHTLMTCEKFGIAHVGVAENLKAARQILILEKKGLRIGILSMAEHEFGIATKTSWGANPLSIIDFIRNVENCRDEFDYLIVLLHGGNEHYPYPRPSLMDTCRFLVEQGANAVICQHSHCPGCYETYHGSHIVYGQGNLIFDTPSIFYTPSGRKPWHEGFLVILQIGQDYKSKMEIIPYTQSDASPGVQRMRGNQEKDFRVALKQRSEAILDESFVETQWSTFCRDNKQKYLGTLCSNNFVSRKMRAKFGFLRYFYSKKSLRLKLNLMRCESHRDVLIKVLSEE